jgi:hypothetical protein
MAKAVSDKMGLKPNMRAILLNAPDDAIKAIDPPTLELEAELNGSFDYIHFFAHSQAEFHETFPALKSHLKPTGFLVGLLAQSKKGRHRSYAHNCD